MSSFFVFRGEYVWQKEESVSFPDKSQEKYYYNKDLTVSKIEDINGNGDIKNSYSYQYDRNNNIVTQQDKSGITLYKYDALNRISSEYSAEDFIIDYSYDKVGNRISERVSNDKGEYTKKYTYDKENRLTKTEEDNGIDDLVTNYTYDNNGNLLRQKETNISTGEVKEDKELSYDYSNRLIEVKKNGKVKEKNKYDYTGERIEKDTEKGTTKYVYDGTDAIIETDEEGDVSARNYFADTIVSRDTGDKTGYYRYNAEANITEVDSETGDQLASYKYDSFGNIVDECEDFDNPYKYAGYVYDKEADYYYLNARMYDPKDGRFITEDTYGGKTTDPLSLNKYVYCADNPVMYTDPDGHSFFSKIAKHAKKFARKAAKVIRKAAKKIKKAARAVVRTVKKAARAVRRAVTHAVRKVGRAVAHAAKTVACKATSMVRAGVKATSRAAKNIVNTAKKKVLTVEEKAKQEINNFKSQMKGVTSKAVSEITKFTEAKAEELKDKFTGFVKEASKEFAAVKEDIGSAIDGVGKFIDKHSEAISNVLSVVSVAATVVGIFVPAIGVAMIAVSRTADVLNTIVAIKSGDKGDIVMSAIGILPTSKLGKGLKIAEEGGEDALKAAKVASAAIEDGKQVEKNSSSLCKILKKVGNPGCFTAGTVVAVEKGYKKIEDVKVGDKVWSKNIKTGKIKLKKVVRLYKHKANYIVHLKINGNEIKTTINHPYFYKEYNPKDCISSRGKIKDFDFHLK